MAPPSCVALSRLTFIVLITPGSTLCTWLRLSKTGVQPFHTSTNQWGHMMVSLVLGADRLCRYKCAEPGICTASLLQAPGRDWRSTPHSTSHSSTLSPGVSNPVVLVGVTRHCRGSQSALQCPELNALRRSMRPQASSVVARKHSTSTHSTGDQFSSEGLPVLWTIQQFK